MKKSLVFAMAMALGVSATAFAANPFSDLPAGHWAYGAVAKLAAAGVVDGYPDGTFKGDKTMTRYEMAQIVAKALAKGAIGADDKLVSEFADELDNLGVRVAKLEKNADNVKITGNIRQSYDRTTGDFGKSDAAVLRSRLWFTGEVNDNWHYVGMLQNQQNWIGKNESGDSETTFQRAFLTGNIGVVNLKAGRDNNTYAEGNVWDHRTDAISASVKSGATYFNAAYGKLANKDGVNTDKSAGDKYFVGTIGGDLGNLNLEANYMKLDDTLGTNSDKGNTWVKGDNKIWTAAANYKAGDFKIGAMYLKGDNDYVDEKNGEDDGWVATLAYKGASAAKPGSWGLYGKYYDQGGATYLKHTMNGHYDMFGVDGFKGYMVGGNLTLAKNMVAAVEWYDLKDKGSTDNHAKTLWSQMVVTF
ncbi:MAG: S-layer homology domain-containing protein [Acidaminococcus sp.]|uniref:S-layer homology domain-containing protein n=1 Tax=Acidaminococcus sp. TaxID=1872103 RepID=UPI003F143A1E